MNRCSACRREFEVPDGTPIPWACPRCGSTVLERYCDLEMVGGGGMGDVYQARDPRMGNRSVAVKIPVTGVNPERVRQRFQREITASARLQHENAVRAYDCGEQSGRPYLVMEFVSGRKLSDRVRLEHPLAARRVARIILGVAKALAHAEGQGVVNRDVKPANILLSEPDDVPKVHDYGLALIADYDDQVTMHGALLGTVGYVSPEQATGPHAVTIAADVYSLGCTTFFCLTARPPFEGGHVDETLRQHAEAPRPSVRRMRPDVPETFDQLIREMMAANPRERPSPHQVIQRLQGLMRDLPDQPPSPLAGPGDGHVDVACPSCGNVYHLPADKLGKRIRCPNTLCREIFTVEVSHHDVEPPPPEVAGPTVESAACVEAEIAEAVPADAVEAEPVEAEPVEAEIAAAPEETEVKIGHAEAVIDDEAGSPDAEKTSAWPQSPPEVVEAQAVDTENSHPDVETLPEDAVVAMPDDHQDASEPPLPAAALVDDPFAIDVPGVRTPSKAGASKGKGRARDRASKKAKKPRKPPKPKKPKKPKRVLTAEERRARRMQWIVGGTCAALLIGFALTLWFFRDTVRVAILGVPPEERWEEIMEDYQKGSYDAAKRGWDDFEKDYPENPHVAEIPFFRDMADARARIHSTSGDREEGLALLQQVFTEHRDSQVYKDYSIDIFQSLDKCTGELLDEAASRRNRDKLATARKAFDLMETVGHSKTDSYVLETIDRLRSRIAQTDHALERARTHERIVSLLDADRIADPEKVVDLDRQIYGPVEELVEQNPDLGDDVKPLLAKAYEAESKRVRYVPEDPEALAMLSRAERRDRRRQGGSLVIAWGRSGDGGGATRNPDPEHVVLSLARGVLYAFDKRDGTLCWARRLGVDSDRLPISVRPTRTSPTSLIAVNSEDNQLVSLDPSTGGVLWRYPVGHEERVPLTLTGGVVTTVRVPDDIVAPLTLVERKTDRNADPVSYGLLPTTGGRIDVLELVLGRKLGHFDVGSDQRITLGGCYDPKSDLVFFPADAERIFAIDPKKIGVDADEADAPGPDDPQAEPAQAVAGPSAADVPACRSVLHTEHASGSLRAEPVTVGQYLVVSEASELEHTKLKAFKIIRESGFDSPTDEPLEELSLNGWAWFSPNCGPDRITMVTDQGDLALFGLNLDNESEAIYPIIEPRRDKPAISLDTDDEFRTMAVHAEEHLVWVVVDGRLRKRSIDVLRQNSKPLWPDGVPVGVPLHQAQVDPEEGVFYLTTMSLSGHTYRCTAVDAHSGEILWQRRLGVDVLGDPLVWDDRLLIIDRTGQIYLVTPGGPSLEGSRPRTRQFPDLDALPEGADPHRLVRLGDLPGPIHLVAPVDDGTKLAVKTISDPAKGASYWREIPLPARLHGRPCVCDDYLVVPCDDGCIHRVSPEGKTIRSKNETPYAWTRSDGNGSRRSEPSKAQVYPLAPATILLVDEDGCRLRRLTFRKTSGGLVKWLEQGDYYYLPAPLRGQPLLFEDRLYVLDSSDTLSMLDPADPRQVFARTALDVEVAAGPFVRDGHLLVISEDARLVCLAIDEPGNAGKPRWVSEPFRGRIRGLPVLAGDTLLVADSSPNVTGVRLSDGVVAWTVPLGMRVGAAASPVPYGDDRIMVPMADGTLVVLPIPRHPDDQDRTAEDRP